MGHDKDTPADMSSANADDKDAAQPIEITQDTPANPPPTLRKKAYRGSPKDLEEGVKSKRGRKLGDAEYLSLIESYRLHPKDHKAASLASGVDQRTAKRLYEEGSRGLVSIESILAKELEQAKLAIARTKKPSKMALIEAVQAAKADPPPTPSPQKLVRRPKKGAAPPSGSAADGQPAPSTPGAAEHGAGAVAADSPVAAPPPPTLPRQWKPSGGFVSARPPPGSADALGDPFPPTLSKDRAALHAVGVEIRRQEIELVCNVRDVAIDSSLVLKHLLTGSRHLADRLAFELECLASENLDQRLKPGEIQDRVRLIGHVIRMAGSLGEVSGSVLKMQKELDNGKPFEGLSEDEDLGLNEALRLVNSVGPDAARIERKLRLIQGGGQMDRGPGEEPAASPDDAADESRPTGTVGP